MKLRRIRLALFLSVWMVCMLTACAETGGSSGTGFLDGRNFGGILATTPSEEVTRSAAVFSGACFGIVIDIDMEESTITLFDLVTEMESQYGYSGGTYIMDKYGNDIAANQLSLGDIVDGGYDTGNRMLKELKKSPRVWENRSVRNFSVNRLENTIQIGNSLYEYKDNLIIVSDGKLLDSVSEISNKDELIVRGCENTVYVIEIVKGHGYVTLANASYFEDGVVMIGSQTARRVVEDMILEVPEGEYVLEITKDGVGGQVDILVQKNKETRVDVGSLKGEAKEKGSLRFMIEPEDAVLYIDGKKTDHQELVNLYYGSYKLRIEAENYVTYTGDLLVSESYQRKEIHLGLEAGAQTEQESVPAEKTSPAAGESAAAESTAAETKETKTSAETAPTPTAAAPTVTAPTAPTAAQPSVSAPTATQPTVTQPAAPSVTQPTVSAPSAAAPAVTVPVPSHSEGMGSEIQGMVIENCKIHVEAPVGAAVYFDGEYVGVAPVSFQKVSGEHTIIFRQNGYETKSYAVTISSNKTDSHYSYPALAPN